MVNTRLKQTPSPSSPIGGGGAVRPAAGTATKPLSVHSDHDLEDCLFDNCEGRLHGIAARGKMWRCDKCGAWFTWAGPLSDDDRLILEERAAIKEFDAGMTRHQAEEAAALEYLQGVSE